MEIMDNLSEIILVVEFIDNLLLDIVIKRLNIIDINDYNVA